MSKTLPNSSPVVAAPPLRRPASTVASTGPKAKASTGLPVPRPTLRALPPQVSAPVQAPRPSASASNGALAVAPPASAKAASPLSVVSTGARPRAALRAVPPRVAMPPPGSAHGHGQLLNFTPPAPETWGDESDDNMPHVPQYVVPASGQGSLLPPGAGNDTIAGVLMEKRMYGSWGRGMVKQNGNHRRVVVTGEALATLKVGARLRFTGTRSHHPKYGDQFEVLGASPDVESTDALVSYIQRNYVGAGHKIASDMVKLHEERGTLDLLKQTLIHQPSMLDFSEVTTRTIGLQQGDKHVQGRIVDSLSIRFGDIGIAHKTLEALARTLRIKAGLASGVDFDDAPDARDNVDEDVDDERAAIDAVVSANKILEKNPYIFVRDVEGLTFPTADAIAQRLGFTVTSKERICALMSYALEVGTENNGHTYLNESAYAYCVRRLDPSLNFSEALTLAREAGEPIVIDKNFGEWRYYTARMRQYESIMVTALAKRMTTQTKPLTSLPRETLNACIDQVCERISAERSIRLVLDDSQRKSILGLLTAPTTIHLLTGGPGCGKTTIEEVALGVLHSLGLLKAPRFCAPTGKAAKVLSDRVRDYGGATTLHSMLKFDGSRFRVNAENPLDVMRLDIDESSMLDNFAGAGVFSAVPPDAHMVLLGDPGQLEPIAPGAPFNALLAMDQDDGIDHHHLTVTHRNKGGILALVKAVDAGHWPTDPALWGEWASADEVHFSGTMPHPDPDTLTQLARSIQSAAQRTGGLQNVGVLCPIRKGNPATPGWNVTFLNNYLRDVINPDEEKKVPGTNLRRDDRVIITKNMGADYLGEVTQGPALKEALREYIQERSQDAAPDGEGEDEEECEDGEKDARVVNGDTGWLREAVHRYEHGVKVPHRLILQLDDGRVIGFPAAEMDNLNLAYATTVHAAQGSEYAEVFAFCPSGHKNFMHRRMLLTQLSRAKKRLTIFGDAQVLAETAAREAPHRNCALVERTRAKVREILKQRESDRQDESPHAARPSQPMRT